jgi:hypothetical protein
MSSCSFVENGFTGTEESSPERFSSAIPSVRSEFNFEESITSIECPARCFTGSLSSIRGSIVEMKGLLSLSKVTADVAAGEGLEGSRSRIKPLLLLLIPIPEFMLGAVFLVEISFKPKASAGLVASSESSLTILKIEGVKGFVGLAKRVDVNVVEAAGFVGVGVVESAGVVIIADAGTGVGVTLAFLLALSIQFYILECQ